MTIKSVATRPCRLRGVPTPNSVRINNPRFNAFEDILMTAQVHPSHPSGFVQMGKRSFEEFSPPTEQALAARTANPPAVTIDSVARLGVILPLSAPAIGLRDVAAHAHRFEVHERLVAMVPLVCNDLFRPVAVRDDRLDPAASINVSTLVVVSP
jgi:hypothetical protein